LTVSAEWLATCGGCECSLIDIREPPLELLECVEFLYIPVPMDYKYFGQLGDRHELEVPRADIGIVYGAVRNK